jgi:cytochrome c-type biogenesis protein CcmH/NrfF
MSSWVFAVVVVALWISPVVLIVVAVRVARRFGVDLRRQPPPEDTDYSKW